MAFHNLRRFGTDLVDRYWTDLREIWAGVHRDPFGGEVGRRWERDFYGEINADDRIYAVVLGVCSLIPAIFVAIVASHWGTVPQWKIMAKLFGAPIQYVISLMLTALFIWVGSHLNRVPKTHIFAFKVALRLHAMYPILCFLHFARLGPVFAMLLHGWIVIRGFRKTFSVSLQNTLLFYGLLYISFAMMQLQSL